jgi:hypothetical protein
MGVILPQNHISSYQQKGFELAAICLSDGLKWGNIF